MCVCVCVCQRVWHVATYILCELHVCMSACMYVMRVYVRVMLEMSVIFRESRWKPHSSSSAGKDL